MTVQESTGKPATDLVLGFVNTRPTGNGAPERMGDAESLRQWVQAAGLGGGDENLQVTDADAAVARELRAALVVLLLSHVGVEEHEGAVAAAEGHLRRTAELYPLVAVVTANGCELAPSQRGVPGVFGSLFAAMSQATASGLWPRMKMCRNLPCHVSFLDKTRNSAGLYCSPACLSQVSMRSYRQRLKANGDQAETD
ncbi:CGNR zinc finger domain-containing protein [Microtetraspora sp. NBRC 13810]|uniref:CGNR zinc finger domain-containing protein n=1 Tax=Microtetraspora sp. NBRC 13810 TaxID=3030990 RepID=UPI00255228E1|nr:CGNR zinc finger domain-containing protein [Microtetraspora sp. NBRC 13810]